MAKRLKYFIMTRSDIVFGYKWIAQHGNWAVFIIRNKDVYNYSIYSG